MTDTPELDHFKAELRKLKGHKIFKHQLRRGEIQLGRLALTDVAALMLEDAARYFLLAAANLNRTQLKKATRDPESAIVEKTLRQAHAVKQRLPMKAPFDEIVARAESLRKADLGRKQRGGIEALFRERLDAEKIPVLMAPPIRVVPGILVSRRKPDGVWPDPSKDLPPQIYLEIKNVRRVADDIQKRLYEIAEASLEMKLLYGNLSLQGLGLTSASIVLDQRDEIRAKLRKQILRARPAVVALFLCPRNEAERYRAGAEAFIDRLFFQEEVEDCLAFLRSVAKPPTSRPRS
jgi:hypothetical protein